MWTYLDTDIEHNTKMYKKISVITIDCHYVTGLVIPSSE